MRTLPGGKPIQVLLVDDDPGDVRLTIEALKESKLHTHIDIVEDGREVLATINRSEYFSSKITRRTSACCTRRWPK